MSNDEKTKLKQNIQMLTIDQKKGVLPIVKKCLPNSGAGGVLEF